MSDAVKDTVSAGEKRLGTLLDSLGIDLSSFQRFLDWALCEHLVAVLKDRPEFDDRFFSRLDALRLFRDLLNVRTARSWTPHDVQALFDRVKMEKAKHYRDPIPYEEYLKLLWQVPLECVKCHRKPPEVTLHIDHILPASRGGKSTRANLQFLCRDCNLKKSNKREVTGPWLNLG